MSDRRPRLPSRDWLRLQEATTLAFYGMSFSSPVDSLRDLNVIEATIKRRRYPSLYRRNGRIAEVDSLARQQAEGTFNERLSEAALAGNVRFKAHGVEVSVSHFTDVREFSLVDDTIRAKFGFRGREIAAELTNVMVERSSFLAWLATTYPQLRLNAAISHVPVSDEPADGALPLPSAGAAPVSPGPTPMREAILEADAMLWPEGPPKGTTAKARRAEIRRQLDHMPSISDKTFQRCGIGKV